MSDTATSRARVAAAVAAGEPLAGGYLFWNVTELCPNSCAFCEQQERYHDAHEVLDGETFARVAREAYDDGFRELFLAGGEPGMLAATPDYVAMARQLGFTVAVFTSGAGAQTAQRLAAAKPHRVTLSLDSAEPDIHDRMRNRAGAFRDARSALEALNACGGVRVDLHAVVTRDNLEHLTGLVELAKHHGIPHLALSLVLDTSGRSRASMRPNRAMLQRYLHELVPDLIDRAGSAVVVRALPIPLGALGLLEDPTALATWLRAHRDDPAVAAELDHWADGRYNAAFRPRFGCLLPLRDLTVAPNGDVYPCSSATAFQSAHVVGNIYDASLSSIRRSSRLRKFYENIPSNPCCESCHAFSNMSDGSYLVRAEPDQVSARLWRKLAPPC